MGPGRFWSRLLTPALSSLGEEREKKREFRVGYEIRPLDYFGYCSKAFSKCNWQKYISPLRLRLCAFALKTRHPGWLKAAG